MGDPAGIGPDIVLRAWQQRAEFSCPFFLTIGDRALYEARAALLPYGRGIRIQEIAEPEEAAAIFANALPVLQMDEPMEPVLAGKPSPTHSAAIIGSIKSAADLTIAGRTSAMVTAPIAKDILLQHGFPHAGHTEFLAELAIGHGFTDAFPVMLMASSKLKAIPVTVHIALKDVPSALTQRHLIRTAEVASEGLARYFQIEKPRLAICGLNPHAGENGELGREEIGIIAPAIAELRARGIQASGPYPADTLFHDAARKNYDAVLAMYHDQALIPFKTLSFEDGVNVTLGLPFIRTSPDHGTAFGLAGTGLARPASFIEALHLARRMYEASRPHRTP